MEVALLQSPIPSCAVCPLGAVSRSRCPFTPTYLPAGALVCGQGERSARVGFVREGVVSLTRVEPDGTESVALRGPRSLVNIEALRSAASPYEVRALSDVRLCAVDASVLGNWVGPEDSPARAVMELVLADGELRQRDLSWRSGDALARSARFLLAVGLRPAGAPPLQKQLVARLLGMRPETLSRALRMLSEQGLVEAGPEARVRDPARLHVLAGGPALDAG